MSDDNESTVGRLDGKMPPLQQQPRPRSNARESTEPSSGTEKLVPDAPTSTDAAKGPISLESERAAD